MKCNPDKEKRLNQNILIVVAGCFLLIATPSWAWEPWSYSAEPIDGRVSDKETGQPIEGAVVVAQWVLATPLEGDEKDFWVVIEAVTDKEGLYHIPGWGPKTRPWFRWLYRYDPGLVVFRPGYWPSAFLNGDPKFELGFNARGSKIRKSYWNGKDILLVPFRLGESIEKKKLYEPSYVAPEDEKTPIEMTEEKWEEQISNVQEHVAWGRYWTKKESWTEEDWLKIKNLVRLIHEECLKLPSKLRYDIRRLPDDYKSLLLGDTPSCP